MTIFTIFFFSLLAILAFKNHFILFYLDIPTRYAYGIEIKSNFIFSNLIYPDEEDR